MTNLNVGLKAKTREITGKKVDQLRKQGKIPAVLYGHKVKPINLIIDYASFEKTYQKAGESTLVDLVVNENKPVKVLIQDLQKDPITDQFIHIDFYQVRMDEKLHTEIELKFIGEAPAVKESNGVLVTSIHAFEVECLPQYLVHEIEVDLSTLHTFNDAIHVADVKVPEGMTVLNVPDDVVALVQPPRTEKELADLEQKPAVELPEEVKEPEEGQEAATNLEAEKETNKNKKD